MRSARDVLRRPALLAPLLDAATSAERVVLLGDVLELRHGPARDALSVAGPVLSALGAAIGSGREVVLVPGNHDHHLLAWWLERRARHRAPPPLGCSQAVDWQDDEPLAAIAQHLAPASLRVSYPGIWLREDVYAMHGHYGDRHTTVPMFERLGAGLMTRLVREPPGGPQRAEDYEAILAPIYAWLYALAQTGGPNLGASSHGPSAQAWRALEGGSDSRLSRRRRLRRRSLILAFPAAVAALNRARIGPLGADLSGPELRRAGLRAVGEAIRRLDIRAAHVIFGHTHRAGPLAGDDTSEWVAQDGSELLNTGCWIHEPRFLGDAPRESPYRAGFAAWIERGQRPRLVNLFDGTAVQVPA